MTSLFMLVTACAFVTLCILLVLWQRQRDAHLAELLVAYEDALLQWVEQPHNAARIASAQERGRLYYQFVLPGAYSQCFQESYPVADFYHDFQAVLEGQLHHDMANARTKHAKSAPVEPLRHRA